jgi:hypothetical protein
VFLAVALLGGERKHAEGCGEEKLEAHGSFVTMAGEEFFAGGGGKSKSV